PRCLLGLPRRENIDLQPVALECLAHHASNALGSPSFRAPSHENAHDVLLDNGRVALSSPWACRHRSTNLLPPHPCIGCIARAIRTSELCACSRRGGTSAMRGRASLAWACRRPPARR